VVLTLAGWSSVPLFLKHFASSIDLWTSNGWRYGFSALLWAPVLVWGWRRKTLPAGLWRASLVPAAFNSVGQVCFTAAHYQIDPGLLTFGLRTQILFVALGALLLFPAERVIIRAPGFIAGAVMVFAGAAGTGLLAEGGVGGASAAGFALAIGSGLMFAGYALSVRHFMHGMPSLTAFAAISQLTALVMIVLMAALGERMGAGAAELGGEQFALLLVSAFIGIALGHVAYYMAIARLGVAVSSGVLQLQPILVSFASLGLFGERLSAAQWGCGGVAIAGAGLILYTQHTLHRRAGAGAAHDEEEFAELPPDMVAAAACGEAEGERAD